MKRFIEKIKSIIAAIMVAIALIFSGVSAAEKSEDIVSPKGQYSATYSEVIKGMRSTVYKTNTVDRTTGFSMPVEITTNVNMNITTGFKEKEQKMNLTEIVTEWDKNVASNDTEYDQKITPKRMYCNFFGRKVVGPTIREYREMRETLGREEANRITSEMYAKYLTEVEEEMGGGTYNPMKVNTVNVAKKPSVNAPAEKPLHTFSANGYKQPVPDKTKKHSFGEDGKFTPMSSRKLTNSIRSSMQNKA